MSRNKNYTNYASYHQDTMKEETPVEVSSDLSQVDDQSAEFVPDNTIVVKKVETIKKYKLNNCIALNVRVLPNGDIIEVVNKGDTLIDNGASEDPDWVKVKTGSGIFGYVKKEFVSEI